MVMWSNDLKQNYFHKHNIQIYLMLHNNSQYRFINQSVVKLKHNFKNIAVTLNVSIYLYDILICPYI